MFRPASRQWFIAVVALTIGAPSSLLEAQKPPLLPPASISIEEANGLAQYWAAIASGKSSEVAGRLRQLLEQFPRSAGVLAAAVEADIVVNGAISALALYERWLGTRTVEEPLVVRRIARAVLYEWARQETIRNVQSEALLALAADGDGPAQAAIAKLAQGAGEGSVRAGTRLSDPAAINAIATRMRNNKGSKERDIDLLGDSRSPLAIPVLIEVLKDIDPRNRGRAATQLGNFSGGQVIDALRPLLKDENASVRLTAAGALFRQGNREGIAILEELANSPNPRYRKEAAQMMASQPDQAWMALVRGLLTESDPSIRADAAALIAPHDPEAARQVLSVLALDANPAVREDVELIRAELPTSSLAELRAMMRSASPMARVKAAGRVLAATR